MQTRICTCPISHLRTTGRREDRVPSEKMRTLQHADQRSSTQKDRTGYQTPRRSCVARSHFHTTLAPKDCIFSHVHIQLSTQKTLEHFGKGPLRCSCRVVSKRGESGTRTSPSLSRRDLESLHGREGPRSYRVTAHACPHVAGLTSVILHTHTLPGLGAWGPPQRRTRRAWDTSC